MAAACEETLAGGLWRDDRRHRRAVLRELDREAAGDLLDSLAADGLPAERVTALLSRAVVAIGEVTPISADEIRELPVGDRDRLVLALRRMLHGDQLRCVFQCGCGETLELELSVGELLGAAEPEPMPPAADGVTADGSRLQVRPACGSDQERAARLALVDPAAAEQELLVSCVLEARAPDGSEVAVDGPVAEQAEALIAGLDPGAELLLAGDCPACGARVTAALDPISHLWTELEQHRAELEYEVHVLALHYHWSEHEIVALTPARRARYLDQIDRQFAVR